MKERPRDGKESLVGRAGAASQAAEKTPKRLRNRGRAALQGRVSRFDSVRALAPWPFPPRHPTFSAASLGAVVPMSS